MNYFRAAIDLYNYIKRQQNDKERETQTEKLRLIIYEYTDVIMSYSLDDMSYIDPRLRQKFIVSQSKVESKRNFIKFYSSKDPETLNQLSAINDLCHECQTIYIMNLDRAKELAEEDKKLSRKLMIDASREQRDIEREKLDIEKEKLSIQRERMEIERLRRERR